MSVVSADVQWARAIEESHLEECSSLCAAVLPDIMFFRL